MSGETSFTVISVHKRGIPSVTIAGPRVTGAAATA